MTLQQHFCQCVWLIGAMAGLSGCLSLERAAPPVEQLKGTEGVAERLNLAMARDIYITRCAQCHEVKPVTEHSLPEWEAILPKEAEKAHLNAAEAESVRAYVLQVLRNGPAPEVKALDKGKGQL